MYCFEYQYQYDGGEYRQENSRACANRIMSLANNDTGANCSWSNEHRHGNCSSQVFWLASKQLDSSWSVEHKLKPDKKKYNTSEYLKRCEFCLYNVGENGITKDGKAAEGRAGNQSRTDQNVSKLLPFQSLDHSQKINADQERIE